MPDTQHAVAAAQKRSRQTRDLQRYATGAAILLAVTLVIAEVARAQSSPSGGDLGPLRLAGDELSYLDFGAGAFNIQAHRESAAAGEGRVEFRYDEKLVHIGPALGLLANGQGGVFGYGGFYADFVFGRFVLTPLGAVGGYSRGGSEDLGGTFEFRLSADLAYSFDNRARLGLQFAHISNADVHDRNPGDNELLVTYAVPLDCRF